MKKYLFVVGLLFSISINTMETDTAIQTTDPSEELLKELRSNPSQLWQAVIDKQSKETQATLLRNVLEFAPTLANYDPCVRYLVESKQVLVDQAMIDTIDNSLRILSELGTEHSNARYNDQLNGLRTYLKKHQK